MNRRSLLGSVFALAAFSAVLTLPAVNAQPAKDPSLINVGLVKAFFNDVDPILIEIAVEPFGKLMRQATGLDGKLCHKDDAFQVAKRLNDNQLQVGVFHGHEFAWVQKKYPKLNGLMIAVNQHRDVRAYVIVPKDSPVKTLADLRGKNVDIPMGTKEHCRVYLDQQCSDNAQQGALAFFKVSRSNSQIAATDKVVNGKADAVVLDTITLEYYKDIKGPTFAKYLRVLQQSEAFPSPVIAYKQGNLDAATIKKFHDGLANAHTTPDGIAMMKMWQIDRFQPLPGDYSKSLAATLKLFPLPAAVKVAAME